MTKPKLSIVKALCLFTIALLFRSYAISPYFSDYDTFIRFHWKGAISSHSIVIKVFPYLDNLTDVLYSTHIVLYTKALDTNIIFVSSFNVNFELHNDNHPVGKIEIDSLTPLTQYFYTFVFTEDASIDPNEFTIFYVAHNPLEFEFEFKTLGVALKPFNFTFGSSSCAQTGSAHEVFLKLTEENLDFFFHLGDMHYQDIRKNDTELFYNAYYRIFNSTTQKSFFHTLPFFYVWDDHDFGPNNSDGTSLSKDATTFVYHRFIPHSSLKNRLPIDDSAIFPNAPKGHTDSAAYLDYVSDPFYGIFRSFIVGRCLFIVMDLRTFKNVKSLDMFGDEQKAWLENQLRYAGKTEEIKRVFFISSSPWIHRLGYSPTEWLEFNSTQAWMTEIVHQNIYANNKKVLMICGDAHMLAFDDGTNNLYGGWPVAQVGALDQSVTFGGGPYTDCCSLYRGQYGVFEVIEHDDIDMPCVRLSLRTLGITKYSYSDCPSDLYAQNKINNPHEESNSGETDNTSISASSNISNNGKISAIVFPVFYYVLLLFSCF